MLPSPLNQILLIKPAIVTNGSLNHKPSFTDRCAQKCVRLGFILARRLPSPFACAEFGGLHPAARPVQGFASPPFLSCSLYVHCRLTVTSLNQILFIKPAIVTNGSLNHKPSFTDRCAQKCVRLGFILARRLPSPFACAGVRRTASCSPACARLCFAATSKLLALRSLQAYGNIFKSNFIYQACYR